MSSVSFTKMHGAGNDFILIDARSNKTPLNPALIRRICTRRTGIGADGLILLEPAVDQRGFRMIYYNADGSMGEMCGNGARCAVALASRIGLMNENGRFVCDNQDYEGEVRSAAEVRLKMSPARLLSPGDAFSAIAGHPDMRWIDTGVPHLIIPIKGELLDIDVIVAGRELRYHSAFAPTGTNVNFIKFAHQGTLDCRVYERGVENETLACGTGAVACALFAGRVFGWESPIEVNSPGGRLLVEFEADWQEIYLTGPVATVYEGQFNINV